jgi:hypothetical protein
MPFAPGDVVTLKSGGDIRSRPRLQPNNASPHHLQLQSLLPASTYTCVTSSMHLGVKPLPSGPSIVACVPQRQHS